MTDAMSGAAAGAENVRRLREYIDALVAEGRPLPVRNGKPNVSAIALACGFDRQVLYKNPAAKEALDAAVALAGLVAGDPEAADEKPEVRAPDRRDRRIHKLEQENAALRGEVAGLRERLRRLQHVESHMVETGRWVSPVLFPGETGE